MDPTRRAAWALALVLGSSGCAAPPPDAYTSDAGVKGAGAALDIGANTAKEACTLQPDQGGGRIYCGTGVIAAGRVQRENQATEPAQFLSDSAWRSAFDRRFQCGPPGPATVLDSPAATLSCVRRQGGFAQAVVAARIGGALYVADAVGPAAGVIPRAIGVAAGTLPAVPAQTTQASDVDTRRAAEQALDVDGVAAIAQVRSLMDRGARENRQGNYAAAEAAYRAAVTLQQRVIGTGASAANAAAQTALAVPTARLALQISNQGRYSESDPLFGEAARLAASPDQLDPVAAPQVAYLEALDRINRNRPADALALLDKAERGFAANVPPDALTPRPARPQTGVDRLAEGVTDAALAQDTINAEALFGLIEAQRYRAVALRALGRIDEANAVLASARQLYEGRQEAGLVARYYRSVGMAAAATGRAADAASDLGVAVDKFAASAPGSLPLAQTEFLRAAELNRGGNARAALSLCRDAAATLQTLKAGTDAALVVPCLDVLAAEAERHPDEADALRIEMFAMAQRAQGSITSRQIALATARLEQGARDPRVAEAIRRRDTTTDRLDTLYRRRAELAAEKDQRSALGDLDDQIRKARDEQKDADEALQAAAPGFAALVQETVTAQDAWAQLGAREALLAVVMDADSGWVFLLRKGSIAAGRLAGGAAHIDPLVARFRVSVTPGASNTPPPFDADAAQQIYASVVGPVADALAGADAITVAPAGTLLSVPFAALLMGPAPAGDLAHAPFLVRRFSVAHVPSVASFVNLRKAAQTAQAPNPWFGMGGFHPPSLQQAAVSFPPETCGQSARELADASLLPGAQRELDVARKLLGGEGNDELLGPAFTAKAVQGANLKDFRVLHFATHAVLPGELRCQSEPAILTSTPPGAKDASGGLLTASQVAQMSLNAELVILAACNTGGSGGSTVAGAGESLSGLARSFFFAGARSLLVTHWDANDAYTTYLTALFLGGIRDNPAAGPAAALAVAQRRMLDEAQGAQAAQAHPFYWAVLALIGGRGAAGADRMAGAPRVRL